MSENEALMEKLDESKASEEDHVQDDGGPPRELTLMEAIRRGELTPEIIEKVRRRRKYAQLSMENAVRRANEYIRFGKALTPPMPDIEDWQET